MDDEMDLEMDHDSAMDMNRLLHRKATRKLREVEAAIALAPSETPRIRAIRTGSRNGDRLVAHYRSKYLTYDKFKKNLEDCAKDQRPKALENIRIFVHKDFVPWLSFPASQWIAEYVQWSILLRWLEPFEGRSKEEDEVFVDRYYRRKTLEFLTLGVMGGEGLGETKAPRAR
ncbi:MAG: hypothetical protein Q9220_001837 [cf. Caloplaca sp. 1 TL-2023]